MKKTADKKSKRKNSLVKILIAMIFVLALVPLFIFINKNRLSVDNAGDHPIDDRDLTTEKSPSPAHLDTTPGASNSFYEAKSILAEGKGVEVVIANCTSCHSARLIAQNRATRDGWLTTIRWMQRTQGLWELGKNEEIILDYLEAHYAPQEKGRRENLKDIEWYEYSGQ